MITFLMQMLSQLDAEEGQDLIEYALLIVLIVLVVALALPAVGTAISAVFTNIAGQLST